MGDALSRFFSAQSEEQKQAVQNSVDRAPIELKAIPISAPGNYLCEITTFAYRKKGEDAKQFPDIFISAEKKSLNLTINLKVVDGTPRVPQGSGIFMNIVLSPGPTADGKPPSQEAIDKIMRFTKPRLYALTGAKSISITPEWIHEYLQADFEEQRDGSFKLVKDHKMKEQIMAIVDEVLGRDGKPRLTVKNIVQARKGDKSETFVLPGPSVPPPASDTSDAPSFAGAVDHGDVGIGEDASAVPHVPDVEDF